MRYFSAYSFLTNRASHLFKATFSFDIFSQKFSKKLSNVIAQAKNSVWLRNSILFLCLFAIPIGTIFIKDYVNDQIERSEIEHAAAKSLISSAEIYAQLLEGLKHKILLEKLYQNKEGMQKLLADVNALKAYAAADLGRVRGLRWVSSHLKAMGPYGDVHNFDLKFFLTFLRSLDQTPNVTQIISINKTVYLGVAIAEGADIIGYLLLPFPLEILLGAQSTIQLRTFQLSPELKVPALGIPLEEFIKNASAYFHIQKTMRWRTYGLENALTYSVFLLFACVVLFFKRKNDRKKAVELLRSKQKEYCLTNTLLAQQKVANLIIHRLHAINESIGDISHVFLETHGSATVFTEQEQMHFIRKVCDFSTNIEKKIIKNSNKEAIDIKEVITGCINFYGHRTSENHIEVKQDYGGVQPNLLSDKDAFTQLMMNLFHMALERTPEGGFILVRMNQLEEIHDGFLTVIIEDNGYSFSSTELKNYKKPSQPLFEEYFDLEWIGILELARHINGQVSLEKIAPVGNRIILRLHEQKAVEDESAYEKYAAENNIIRLFPGS